MSQIVNLVSVAMQTWLTQKLITEIAVNDPTRANLVKVGRLQVDPVKNAVHVTIEPGDPDAPGSWQHELYTNTLNSQAPYANIFGEVGGREELWWRKFSAEVGCYYVTQGFNQLEANDYAHVVLGRLENAIEQCQTVLGLTDQFGERTHAIYVTKSQLTESGGPPTQYIWRGKVWFQIQTSRSLS